MMLNFDAGVQRLRTSFELSRTELENKQRLHEIACEDTRRLRESLNLALQREARTLLKVEQATQNHLRDEVALQRVIAVLPVQNVPAAALAQVAAQNEPAVAPVQNVPAAAPAQNVPAVAPVQNVLAQDVPAAAPDQNVPAVAPAQNVPAAAPVPAQDVQATAQAVKF